MSNIKKIKIKILLIAGQQIIHYFLLKRQRKEIKDKINNKTIKSKNTIISHIADIKDKNKKIINLTNRYYTRKRVKKIKSVNKNNITFNENNTISSINKKKRKLKIIIKTQII